MFVAIGNFYYVGIYHSVDLYQYIVLYSVAIVNCDYRRKIKKRKKNVANIHTYCITVCFFLTFILIVSNYRKRSFFMIQFIFFLFSQRNYIMLQILIVSNHRKNGYYVIYHPSICKYYLQLILFRCGVGLQGHETKFYILTLFILKW